MPSKKQENESLYNNLLSQYKEISQRLKGVPVGDPENFRLDNEKNRMHSHLKRIGGELGKSQSEVFSDIMGMEGDLSDYGLPEFKVINHEGMQQSLGRGSFEGEIGVEEDIEIEGEIAKYMVRDLGKNKVAIIFTREDFVGLVPPNPHRKGYERSMFRGIPMHLSGIEEIKRRVVRFANDNDLPVFMDDFFSHNFSSHTYGVVVDKENFDRMVSRIRDNRERYGIRPEDLDQEIVERDWEKYKKEIAERLVDLEKFMGVDAARYFFECKWNEHFDPGTRMLTDEEFLEEMYRREYIDAERREKGFPQREDSRDNYHEYVDREGDTDWTLPPEDEEWAVDVSGETSEPPLSAEEMKDAWLRGEKLKGK